MEFYQLCPQITQICIFFATIKKLCAFVESPNFLTFSNVSVKYHKYRIEKIEKRSGKIRELFLGTLFNH